MYSCPSHPRDAGGQKGHVFLPPTLALQCTHASVIHVMSLSVHCNDVFENAVIIPIILLLVSIKLLVWYYLYSLIVLKLCYY